MYSRGKTVRLGDVALRFVPNNRQSKFRCAVVVSKKIEKSAVKRNRIRRRITAIVRDQAPTIKQPYDLVFTIYNGQIIKVPAEHLQKTIKDLIQKAQIS